MSAEMNRIRQALRDNAEHVIRHVAEQIAHLGARPEWSMDDNFACTEGMAGLAGEVGLPSAGDQTDEALEFYAAATSADEVYDVGGFPRVEIKQHLNAPTTCKVWRGQVLAFDGIDRSVLLRQVCPVCGQPDNCGDCTHEPVSLGD